MPQSHLGPRRTPAAASLLQPGFPRLSVSLLNPDGCGLIEERLNQEALCILGYWFNALPKGQHGGFLLPFSSLFSIFLSDIEVHGKRSDGRTRDKAWDAFSLGLWVGAELCAELPVDVEASIRWVKFRLGKIANADFPAPAQEAAFVADLRVIRARLRALLPGADRLIAAGWALSSMTLLSPDERLVGFQLHFAMGLVAAGVSLPPMPGPAPENESEGEPASEPEEDSDLPDPVA
ncbi:MAG TPA: hypothetical protein QF764_11850 [Planctomycetota bacterium]|jgi:hypothetical protein|nr:hypothetical protein [Planctomycetota bacterium]